MEERRRTKAEYRSSLRSKRLIREALITMMRDKPLGKITITDIVKTADINRGTFYAHFRDIEEVMESIRTLASAEIEEAFKGLTPDLIIANPKPLFESFSAMLEGDKEYYRLLLSVEEFRKGVVIARKTAVSYLMNASAIKQVSDDPDKRAKLECSLDFIVSAIIACYTDALEETISINLNALPDFLTGLVGGIAKQISDLPVK